MVFGALLAGLVFASAATAETNPIGCVSANPQVQFSEATLAELSTPLRDGDRLVVGARVGNQSEALPCDLTDLTVLVHLPDNRGVPGEGFPVANPVDLAAGTSGEDLKSTIPFMVDLDPDVFSGTIGLSWTARVKGSVPDLKLQGEVPGIDFRITRPAASLKVTADKVSGEPPLTVNYKYELTNTSPFGDFSLSRPVLISRDSANPYSVLSDSNCSPLNLAFTKLTEDGSSTGLDSAGEQIGLIPGESWHYDCAVTYRLPGTYSSRPSVDGLSQLDGREWPEVTTEETNVTVNGTDLIVTKSHQGDFLVGNSGTYYLKVTNRGNRPTSGEISLVDHLPKGLRAIGMEGFGWKCEIEILTCRRSDVLHSGISFQDVTVLVMPTSNPPSHVVNTASVSGGGESEIAKENNSTSDPTRIRRPSQPSALTGGRFKLVKVLPRNDASTIVTVSAMGAGRLNFTGASKQKLIKKATKRVPATGPYSVRLKPTAKLRRKLKRRQKPLPVRVRIQFKPKSGATRSIVRSIPFKLRTR